MLRQELPEDYKAVEKIIYDAFISAGNENPENHMLVEKLRNSAEFIPELSIVVQEGWDVVGHAISTSIKLETKDDIKNILVLKTMGVMPVLQRSGVGLQLIMETVDIAKKLGYGAIVVKGYADYFAKFGFKPAKDFNITCNVDNANEVLFVKELQEGYLSSGGKIIYWNDI